MKTVYKFVDPETLSESERAAYRSTAFDIFFYRPVYFFKSLYQGTRYSFNKSYKSIPLISIIPIKYTENLKRYRESYSITSGNDEIEVRRKWLKKMTNDELSAEGIISELVAMRLKGEDVDEEETDTGTLSPTYGQAAWPIQSQKS